MDADDDLYHRTDYARTMAEQLLNPGPLQTNVRSGVFLYGIRRVGKSTFLNRDLVPALEAMGALVVYVDLWTDRGKSPATLVQDAVRATLAQLQTPGSALLQRLKGLNLGAAGLSFGFQVDSVGAAGGTTLAQAFTGLVTKAKADVVLIVDEVQDALGSEDGQNLLHALKAARDAVNGRPRMPGRFLFLGTGSHKSLVADMASRRSQPFTGAVAASYEVLGKDFVKWQLRRVGKARGVVLPGLAVAWAGFQAMGHRPEELLRALNQLQSAAARGVTPEQAFPIICDTLATAAADVELRAIDDFGALGHALFSRIAAGPEEGMSKIFSAEALAEYGLHTGGTVETNQVQGLADKMIAANLVVRPGHGVYAVVDPFVRQVWLNRRQRGRAAPK